MLLVLPSCAFVCLRGCLFVGVFVLFVCVCGCRVVRVLVLVSCLFVLCVLVCSCCSRVSFLLVCLFVVLLCVCLLACVFTWFIVLFV